MTILATLDEGARNAVEVCMGVKPGEHVLVVTDRPRYDVGDALRRAAEAISPGNVKLFILEDFGSRPMTALPKPMEDAVPWANVTFYAAESQEGELGMRGQLIRLAVKYARHGHLPSIKTEIMEDGMCADYAEVAKLTRKLYEVVKDAKTARVGNAAGTDLRVEFDPNWKWIPSDGIYHEKGKWGNLPDGEVFTAAKRADGILVIDELGDWFSEKYGLLKDSPVTVRVSDSTIDLKSLKCRSRILKKDLLRYLKTDENSNRLSEFAIGTNIYLKKLIGNLLQDEKFPTVHVAFGDPYDYLTGADWSSKTHVDGIMSKCTVWIDGKKVMERGKHLV